jgi:protocatechuate 3,4-dioxygenase beta subunit
MSSRLGLAAAALLAVAAAFSTAAPAAACAPTPTDAFGPFGSGLPPLRAKIGAGHVLTGVVLSAADCRPLARATVELWQAGKNGRYTRAGSATVRTDRRGRFRFEGPYPPAYSSAPPHIHLRVSGPAHQQLLTRFVPAKGERRGSVSLVLRPEAV